MLICLPQLIFPSSFTVQVICRRQFYSLRFQKLLIPYLEYCFYLLGTRKLFGPGWLIIPNTSRNLVIPLLIKRVEKWEHKPLSWEQMSFCMDIRHDACYNVSSKRNIFLYVIQALETANYHSYISIPALIFDWLFSTFGLFNTNNPPNLHTDPTGLFV